MAMTQGVRRFALTVHVAVSVALLGAVAAFLELAVAGLISRDVRIVHAAYPAMELITWFVIIPLTLAALLTGFVSSSGTSWGLFRYYWVVIKLLLTGFATVVLLLQMPLIAYLGHTASETALTSVELRMPKLTLVVHSSGGLFVLLVITVLSIYKPKGMTPFGQRKQGE